MAIDRSKMRKSLQTRQEESTRNAESGGGRGFIPYIDEKALPIPLFKKIPEGTIVFDIIPFQVSEKFLIDPVSRRPQYVPGEWYYYLDLHVHQKIGPSNHNVICPKMHLGKPCPICDIADAKKQGIEFGDKEGWKAEVMPFLPKRRSVYQIWIHDKSKDEEDKGVQVLEISFHSLEKELLAIAKDPETDETIDYAWPGIEGKKITFTRKGTGMTNTSYVGYKFLDRKEEIPDEIVDGTCAINEYITIMTPEEIKKLMNAGEDEDEEEKPRRGNKATKDTDDDDSERKARPNRLGRKAKDEDDTDDSEDEKPKRRAKVAEPENEPEEEVKPRRRAKPAEDDDEEEEKPRSRREKREAEAKAEKPKKENPCTFGHKFGVDTDDYEDCEECPEKLYNKCAAKKDDDAD